jgi:2-keto-4-pentenoate hydratase/2-oxohepta-3-ene-1,7-dioic acid hydratase in catechol pathway
VTDIAGRLFRIDHGGAARYAIEQDGAWRALDGDPFGSCRAGGEIDVRDARWLPPVDPSKIVAVGLNYRDHATETNKPIPAEPLIFIKPSTAVIGPGADIVLPPGVGRVDYEAEVGIVIGRRARRVPASRAREVILGVIAVNDVTARELQRRDGQFTRAKGFDTFAPIGPAVALGFDGGPLAVEGWVNDRRRQASSTRELIFPIEVLVEFISHVMTLLPGDVIATGTPSGIGPLAAGDRVVVKVERAGELSNGVVAG